MQKLLNKRERVFIFLTLAVVAFSILFYFLIEPTLSRNAKLNQEISTNRLKLKKYLQLLSQKEYIRSRYNELASSQPSSNVSQNTLVNALAEIETLARLANIRIVDIRPQNSGGNTNKEMIFGLRTEGAIEGYIKFNYSIENSPLLLRIKKFQLNVKSGSAALEGTFIISQPSLE